MKNENSCIHDKRSDSGQSIIPIAFVIEPKLFNIVVPSDRVNVHFLVLKTEQKKAKCRLEFCDRVSPEVLKTEWTTIEVTRKGVRKPMELAFKHFSLAQLIRIREEWSIPASLQSALSHFDQTIFPVEKLQELKSELKNYWNTFNPQHTSPKVTPNQRQSGKIDRILHQDEKGADGFIRFDGRKTIYFRVSTSEKIIKNLNVGLDVEFIRVPATADKKEKAIQLKVK